MKIALDIVVPSDLWRGLPRARALARETIAAAVAESGLVESTARPGGRASFHTPYGAEVSLCLADDARLQALNLRWRGVDKPTNVLSFPAAPVDAVADRVSRYPRPRLEIGADHVGRGPRPRLQIGDIALAYETLAREASELGVPLADHYRHLIAHGFLHLLGYDHETAEEAERMEALESRIMARLGAADPYAREVVDG